MPRYFMYSRKSSEDEDRQVQSIESQEDELKPIAARLNLTIVEPLSEAQSAKAPGRPVFNEMMRRINRGEADGILCWKLDRLARNPIDGGAIIWAMKEHDLIIRTPQQTFSQAEDNQILMYIEFGMAQKYIDDLSRNTKRGLKAKAEKGWCPGSARLGYLNSKVEEPGDKIILVDADRFAAVRRMWDLMLSGNYNPSQIQKIANEEWGFRTRQTKRAGGKPLSRSTIYKMFADPFYFGTYEYPQGSGKWHHGKHRAMVTESEFEFVRKKLSEGVSSRSQTSFHLPFTGLLRCGECNSTITAHFKEQVRCTACHLKSSIRTRQSCSKCGLSVSDMKAPIVKRYSYYHCTRTLKSTCRQKCVSSASLEQQVVGKIAGYALPEKLKIWGMDYIRQLLDQESGGRRQILSEQRKMHDQCVLRLENLLKLKTAPENMQGSLLSDEEYQKQRRELLAEKAKLSTDRNAFQAGLEKKVRFTGQLLEFAATIDDPRRSGVMRAREVLRALGSNHVIFDKNLVLKPEFPFSELPRGENPGVVNLTPIEPENIQAAPIQNPKFTHSRPRFVPESDKNRTKALKSALDNIWKKMNIHSSVFDRFPFNSSTGDECVCHRCKRIKNRRSV